MAAKSARADAPNGQSGSNEITLDQLCSGERAEVIEVDDQDIRAKVMRLGICRGEMVSCVTKVPAGPIVLKHGRQEIALGRALAKKISVRRDPVNEGGEI